MAGGPFHTDTILISARVIGAACTAAIEQPIRSSHQLPQTAAVLSGSPSRGATAGASGIIRVSQTVGSAGRRGVIAAKLGIAAAENPGMMVVVAMASCRRWRRGAGSHHRRCGHDRENLFHQLPPLSPHPSTPGPASGSATHLLESHRFSFLVYGAMACRALPAGGHQSLLRQPVLTASLAARLVADIRWRLAIGANRDASLHLVR
jgi:hypothetical protein